MVKIDNKQMQEVFMNILKNSAEAMPEGGTITVATSKSDDGAIVEIKDTGKGISEGDMEHIFDPFFTTREMGTGLGLSVSYGIVKLHGGDLKYASTPGKGVTATIFLPLLK
jgi:signal transduction histidine kinase